MSTIDNGHLEVSDGGEEGAEEAGLVRRREGVNLHASAGCDDQRDCTAIGWVKDDGLSGFMNWSYVFRPLTKLDDCPSLLFFHAHRIPKCGSVVYFS